MPMMGDRFQCLDFSHTRTSSFLILAFENGLDGDKLSVFFIPMSFWTPHARQDHRTEGTVSNVFDWLEALVKQAHPIMNESPVGTEYPLIRLRFMVGTSQYCLGEVDLYAGG